MRPLAIDLFCGLFGWSEGLVQEGWRSIGFDIEDMHANFGLQRPPHCHLVIQDVLTLHGSQFKDAALIVASPPCQAYSYRAMPWKRAKALPPPDNSLFEACFRIQREACEAAGRHIPLIVENVKGAQKWVGRSRWAFGSYHLWGDVPALMPPIGKFKSSGMNWSDRSKRGQDFTRIAGDQVIKNGGGSWFKIAHNTTSGKGQNPDGRLWKRDPVASAGSGSKKRKFASAMIAKIPLLLSRHIARTFKPHEYDAQKDLAGSIKEGFTAICQRIQQGGEGWQRKT